MEPGQRLEQLADAGEELKSLSHEDPEQGLWNNDVKAAVTPYGAETVRVLERAMYSHVMAHSDSEADRNRVECIEKTQKLLRSLAKRSLQEQAQQSNVLAPDFASAKKQVKEKIASNITINGPATFGDNSPATQITIGEFFAGLEQQVEESLPDGPERHRLLNGLKAITSDPAFVAVASAATTEVLKRLIGQ